VLPKSTTVVQEGDTIYVAALAGTIHDVAESATIPPEGA
jgi:hypothetical protein